MTALTYPVSLPNVLLYCESFELETDIQSSVNFAGTGLMVENSSPVFRAAYRTPPLVGLDFQTMRSFIDTIKSPPGPVWAWDTRSRYPFAYQSVGWTGLTRAGGGAFDGTCTLYSIDSGGKLITLSGLPVGFLLGPGDRASFPWDTSRQAYHRIVSPQAAADGSGHLTVEVRWLTNAAYSTGATVTLDKPVMKAFLVPGSDKAPRSETMEGSFSFELRQDLRQ